MRITVSWLLRQLFRFRTTLRLAGLQNPHDGGYGNASPSLRVILVQGEDF
jgi:hypothetical protein